MGCGLVGDAFEACRVPTFRESVCDRVVGHAGVVDGELWIAYDPALEPDLREALAAAGALVAGVRHVTVADVDPDAPIDDRSLFVTSCAGPAGAEPWSAIAVRETGLDVRGPAELADDLPRLAEGLSAALEHAREGGR